MPHYAYKIQHKTYNIQLNTLFYSHLTSQRQWSKHPKEMPPPDDAVHPLLRNALRVSLSAKEYKVLHERILKQLSIEHRLPTPSRYEAIVQTTTTNKHNVAAIRASLRVFAAVTGGLSLVEFVTSRIKKEGSK